MASTKEESNEKSRGPVISPSKLAHVVLRTGRFPEMVKYYKDFLEASAVYENGFVAFLSYDNEHHRIAIISMPDLLPVDTQTAGLHHIAFSFDSLHDLISAYRQRRGREIVPFWSVNHGPTTSIYYQDPDGNQIETQVDNFDEPDAANAFMNSPPFAENPIGTDFDPEELGEKLQRGEDEKALKARVEIGPRNMATVPRPPAIRIV